MRLAALVPIVLLAACKPSFDDRYSKAEKDIRTQASGVDNDLARQQAATPSATPEPSASPSATDTRADR
jgi:hypothetical protein